MRGAFDWVAESNLINCRVCYLVESFTFIPETTYDAETDGYGSLSGQIMSAFQTACQETFMGAQPKLVEGTKCYTRGIAEPYSDFI